MSVGLALFLKNNHIGYGVIWIAFCICTIAWVLYPGRYDVASLEAALEAFYGAMEFPSDEHIRCAIYVPIKSGEYLQQVTHYMPGKRGGQGQKVHSSKGIMGRAYREREHRIELLKDANYSSAEFFQSQMVIRWGFTRDDARKLTQDRRAYCVLMIKDDKGNIVGALYCDSNRLSTFEDPNTFEKAQKFAPFFTELLKLRGR